MRTPALALVAVTFAALLPATVARAQSLQVVSSDDKGVTLRLSLPGYRFSAPRPDGRVELSVPGFAVTGAPGRAHLPYAQTLVGLPPGAGATARVLDAGAEELEEGRRLVLGGEPVLRDDGEGVGLVPAIEPVPPILDGPWPAAPVELGEPAIVRGQRLVAVQVRPFRYDEATGRLWVRRGMLVRVDFTGAAALAGASGAAAGAGVADNHWEPVFRSALANYADARAWRVRRPGATAAVGRPRFDRAALPAALRAVAAFDESEPEVRIKVDTTGVYRLPYDELEAKGYPASVPVGEVSLHRHEYIGQVDPPYVTIELAIEVDDANGNGTFDSGDAIIAFVPNWVERSGVTSMAQREWGDAEVVYATRLAGGAGWRVPTRAGWRDATLAPLASYPYTQRWERNYKYFGFPPAPDTADVERFLWTNYSTYYSRPDSFVFETNHLDTTHTVTLRVLLQGTNSNAHNMFVWLKNGSGRGSVVVDSLVWYDRSPRIMTSPTLLGGALSEGLTNRLQIWGKGSAGAPDPATIIGTNSGVNWFEATYWRSYRALGGYLDAGSGAGSGLYQIRATGFPSSALRVYDVTDITSPVRLLTDSIHSVAGEYVVDFQDSTGATARRYIVFSQPKSLASSAYSAVTRRQLAGAVGARDWIAIAPEAFLPAASSLAALRQGQGLDTLVAALESVNDEFNGGRKSKYAIRRFLQWAYGGSGWDTRFVVLMGDASEDGRGIYYGASTDWVPVALLPGPVASGTLGLELVAGDPWYGCCLDQGDACWSSNYLVPDIYVGRLPANSLAQAQGVVAKLAAYEALADDATWRRRMLLLSDDCYSSAATFGAGTSTAYCYHAYEIVFRSLNKVVAAVIGDSAGLSLSVPDTVDLRSYLTASDIYQVESDGDTCRVGNPTPMARAEALAVAIFDPVLFQKLNEGVLWWNYQGHANAYVLSHEGFYRNQNTFRHDYDNLLNDGRLFFFSAFSCHANAFTSPFEATPAMGPSLGEDMVTLASRGAVASWASSAYEIVPPSGSYHLSVEFARSLFDRPPHDDELGGGVTDRGARVVLGEAITLTMLNYLPTVRFSSTERGVSLTYNLLGDPATRLWVGPPQITVTANGLPVTDGEPVRLSTGGDALDLEAELASNVAIDTIRVFRIAGADTAEISPSLYTLTPSFPDTSVAGRGGRRYHLSYTTALSTGEVTYRLELTDRYDIRAGFDVVFEFRTQLFANGVPIQANDVVAPDAALTLLVLSPGTLDPDSLELEVDGATQTFDWELARGDTTGRQYLLSWGHGPYADGTHLVRLRAPGGLTLDSPFRVVTRFALGNALAFPNPFDDELGTRFVFLLTGSGPADVLVRVFTATGRRVYEARCNGLLPGHHEIPWDGLDAEGQKLANGVYFYKLVAHGSSGTSSYDGKLVKLRRPRRMAETQAGSTP